MRSETLCKIIEKPLISLLVEDVAQKGRISRGGGSGRGSDIWRLTGHRQDNGKSRGGSKVIFNYAHNVTSNFDWNYTKLDYSLSASVSVSVSVPVLLCVSWGKLFPVPEVAAAIAAHK